MKKAKCEECGRTASFCVKRRLPQPNDLGQTVDDPESPAHWFCHNHAGGKDAWVLDGLPAPSRPRAWR